MTELRPYQQIAVESALRELGYLAGAVAARRSTLIEAATGTGKTTSFAEIVRRAFELGARRALVLAHRRELVDQALARLLAAGLDAAIERGARSAAGARVVVSSVQTITRRLDKYGPGAFDVIVIDECHHAPAPGYLGVLGHFSSARVLGVTATPDRADGAALGAVFESVAARYGISEAARDGYLARAIGLRVEVPGMDLSKVRRRVLAPRETSSLHAMRDAVDLHPGDLGRAALSPEAVEGVAGPLLDLASDRRTILFAVNRAHAAAIAVALCARRAGCARAVWGSSPTRADDIAAHQAGEFQFLVNVMVLTEGYDDPAIACVAMARPTQSRALYAQACGRGLRLHPSKVNCLILDFVGVSCEHDLVGPEDVLGGALLGPVTRPSSSSAPDAAPIPYAPAPTWRARFKAAAVKLLRGGVRAARRAGQFLSELVALIGK